MKTLFRILAIIILSFAVQSCEKERLLAEYPTENADFYYARFEVENEQYFDICGYVKAGDQSVQFGYLEQIEYFETILGPIKYGDKVIISTRTDYYRSRSCRIYISKNNGPFALKASGKTGASYTIDF